jgi:hypothetical protein
MTDPNQLVGSPIVRLVVSMPDVTTAAVVIAVAILAAALIRFLAATSPPR